MATNNTQRGLVQVIDDLVSPIEFALRSDANTRLFFKALGWDFDRIEDFPFSDLTAALTGINSSILAVRSLLNNPQQTLQDLSGALTTFKNLFDAINSFTSFINSFSSGGLTASFKSEFVQLGSDVINFLVCGYLEANYFKLYATLSVLGIINPYQVAGLTPAVSASNETWVRLPYYRSSIHLENLIPLLADPVGYFKAQFYPASGQLDTAAEAQEFSDKFFPRLELLFQSLGFDTYYSIDPDRASRYTADAASVLKRTLTIVHHAPDFLNYGATLSVSPTNEGGHGLVVRLFGNWTYNTKIEEWLLIIQASASIDVFAINNAGIHFPASVSNADFGILIQLLRLSSDQDLVGSTTGTRFKIGESSVSAMVKHQAGQISYGFELSLSKAQFFIGGEGDNFIKKIIPNGAGGEFDLSIGWNSINGFYINAGGGLEFYFPTHKRLGPIEFEGATLGLYVGGGALALRAGADITLYTGALTASVKDVGISTNLSFPAGGGNLGAVDFNLGFKPPTGVGLSIDSGSVKGSGFLSFNYEKGEYIGALSLTFSKIKLNAIGILNTRMPDGSDGYSLLILITAEFNPIQLGFGFTLSGVGGMLGLHRTMNADALRDGLKSGSLENILFPKDITGNAPAIVSNLNSLFPISQGRFLIAPMAKIGWGTPTLLTIDLGVIIEVPDPVRLAVVGVIRCVLPTEDNPRAIIKCAFVGIVDFDKQYISFDARIYDSQLLGLELSGDMALRIFWGREKEMLLSMGGFNDDFKPKASLNLPDMDRLRLSLHQGNFSLQLSSYFAITSNTVQLGAEAKFSYDAGSITANGDLGFDLLFQFNPFYFKADLRVNLAVEWEGHELLGVHLRGTLSGPRPWHAEGNVSFEILYTSLEINIRATWGDNGPPEPQPEITLRPDFQAALADKTNWRTVAPEGREDLVSVRQWDKNLLVVHPYGRIQVSQKVVPLGVSIYRYGQAKVLDGGVFSITGLRIGGTNLDIQPLLESFSPAQYRDMSDDDKLSADSFEYMPAGIEGRSVDTAQDWLADFFILDQMDYEIITVDNNRTARSIVNGSGSSGATPASWQDQAVTRIPFARGGAIGQNLLSQQARQMKPVGLRAETRTPSYRVVDRDGLSPIPNAPQVFGSRAEALSFQEKLGVLAPFTRVRSSLAS